MVYGWMVQIKFYTTSRIRHKKEETSNNLYSSSHRVSFMRFRLNSLPVSLCHKHDFHEWMNRYRESRHDLYIDIYVCKYRRNKILNIGKKMSNNE